MNDSCFILVDMKGDAWATRSRADMQEVLLDGEASGPQHFYYMLRGGPEKGNVTIWEPGRAGREYIKTLGHYHTWDFKETYRVISGEGIALLQKRAGDADAVLADVRIIPVRAGDTLEIEPGYGHILVNTGDAFLVTIDDSPSNDASRPHADYEPVRRMRGMAYFIVEDNGAPALVPNRAYSTIEHEDRGGLPVLD